MDVGALTLVYSEAINADTFDVSGITLYNADNPTPFFRLSTASFVASMRSFNLYLTQGLLTLTLAETLVESSFNTKQFMFQNARTDAIEYVAITSASYQRVNLSSIVVILTSRNIDEINVIPELGTGMEDTYISLTRSTAEDVLGNQAVPISMDNAQRVLGYIRDTTSPVVSFFLLDLNNNTIMFVFNEVPDPRSVNMSFLTVQNAASDPTLNFTFSGRETAWVVGRTVIITLTSQDIDTLNALDICTSVSNCFALFEAEFIADAAGNRVMPSPILQASVFTEDMRTPAFEQFILADINQVILILEFSETISAANPAECFYRNCSWLQRCDPEWRGDIISGSRNLSSHE